MKVRAISWATAKASGAFPPCFQPAEGVTFNHITTTSGREYVEAISPDGTPIVQEVKR